MALLVPFGLQAALGISAPLPRFGVGASPKPSTTSPAISRAEGERSLLGLSREVEGCLLRHQRRQLRGAQGSSVLAASATIPVNATVVASVLDDMGLANFPPLLSALPAGLVPGASGPSAASADSDLRQFVYTVREQASVNPLLCELAYALASNGGSSSGAQSERGLPPVDDRTMYELVHYTLLLDRVTRALAEDPELAALVYAKLHDTVHSTPGWQKGLGLFELAKLMTVEMTLERFIEHRRDANLPSNFGHVGLPFNILEAVLQDVKLGFHTNAAAGLALCLARPGQGTGPDRPGLGASLSPDERRAVRMHLPLEQQWKDLYVSWNLAFTTTYADPPTRFGAPLLAPVVLGASAEEFMFHRVLALHVHICLFILRRARVMRGEGAGVAAGPTAGLEPPLPAADIRRRSLALAWGRINLNAAQRFERRLRLAPFVAWGKRTYNSGMAARRAPFPAALILPPPRVMMVPVRPRLTARERAERARRSSVTLRTPKPEEGEEGMD